jgi:ribose/xylose/arabinose/galactoside ABC-type transport system permease subunit
MIRALVSRVEQHRKFLPLSATIALFVVVYLAGAFSFKAMQDGQAFFNLFITTPFLIICVVGETFVIVSGGIDLSVSGILALTTVVAASLINLGWNPWVVFPVMLLMGMVFGVVMGYFITYLKVQPFIATLAGMWLARGLCYIISDSEVRIHDSLYTNLNQTKILIPGLADPVTKQGDYISYLVVVALVVLFVGMFIAHFTKFGRTVYAIGGGNGANELSSRLMGLAVNRTKVLVYVISGFCSALAGITYSIYVGSGHGTHATGFELTVIAAVVIGGIALTGGEGYLFGALFGALITALIQSLIQFNGTLSSWWTYIVIGGLMLVFIGVQSVVAAWNASAIGRARSGGRAGRKKVTVWYRTKAARGGAVALAVVLVAVVSINVVLPAMFPSTTKVVCKAQAMRPDQAKTLSQGDAVIVYERNGGTKCVEELYAIYPDGRIVSDHSDGNPKTTNVAADQVTKIVADITNQGWFTTSFYTTHHTPCAACYQYSLTVKADGVTKTVDAVDGGTDAPAAYWPITGQLAGLLGVQ